jgi:hypothetical protein
MLNIVRLYAAPSGKPSFIRLGRFRKGLPQAGGPVTAGSLGLVLDLHEEDAV